VSRSSDWGGPFPEGKKKTEKIAETVDPESTCPSPQERSERGRKERELFLRKETTEDQEGATILEPHQQLEEGVKQNGKKHTEGGGKKDRTSLESKTQRGLKENISMRPGL